MNKLLLLGLALITAAEVSAQQFSLLPPAKSKHAANARKMISNHLATTATAQKPNTIQQRVKAIAIVEPGNLDSLAYTYSGTRGSTYNYNSFGIGFNTYLDIYYTPRIVLGLNENPSNSNHLEADSIKYYDLTGLYMIGSGSYNNIGKLDTIVEVEISEGSIWKAVAEYDVAGQPIVIDEYEDDGFGEEWFYRQLTTYNNSGTQILVDSFYFVEAGSVLLLENYLVYTYNTDGQLQYIEMFIPDLGPDPNMVGEVTWTTDGQIATFVQYNGAALAENLVFADTISYFPGTQIIQSFKEYYIFSSDTSIVDFTRTLNADNLPDSVFISNYEPGIGWMESGTFKYHYNDYGNPNSMEVIGSNPQEIFVNFYYEEYDDENAIEELTTWNNLAVYPNPFNQSISFTLNESDSKAQLHITDMLGRTIYEQQLAVKSGRQTITLPELASGNYLLQIVDSKGNQYRSKVVKE